MGNSRSVSYFRLKSKWRAWKTLWAGIKPCFFYTYNGVTCITMRTDRPWGWYETIEEGHRYKVKNIEIKPGEGISKQFHYHRSEHWVIVNGTALVEMDDNQFMVYENESTFVPLGKIHKVRNPGKIPLRIVEVQVGSYLGEDDITRLEDDYGRVA
tara:strand:- start:1420 stop:1884 length:465 start_codon:yes stop_codon:yes gene_type:complete